MDTTCRWCGQPITQRRRGRPRIWCGDACRKAYGRAATRIPRDLVPLPDPGPHRRIPPEDRLALIISELQAHSRELAVMTRELDSPLAWRADTLSCDIKAALEHTFGGIV